EASYLKFLWWKGGDLEKEPQEYRMAVHLFGAASSPGCVSRMCQFWFKAFGTATRNPSERATNLEPLEFDPTPSERALGIQWSIKDDTFSFNISLKDQPSTRRGCLSVIASLYDPLGFIAPFILKGKRILQELCHKGIGWDDPLPEEMKPRYKNDKDEVHCSLVMAKARVAPSKATSIPRLELAAAVVSTK
ncbi:hypothetical protein L3Q82_021070, partial [Scortum barcoo]